MKKFFKKIFKPFLLVISVIGMSLISACGDQNIAVETVTLSVTQIEITENETELITCSIFPVDANADIAWQSSNIAIATVNELGLVTGIAKGTCVITANAGGKTASTIVIVKSKGPDFKTLYNEMSDTYGWTLGSDGSFLSADTNIYDLDDYSNSAILYEIKDMNRKLGLPASLYNDMINTTWSMGKQEETYESIGIKVTWTYHPDKGMEVTYKLLAA